jgi:hypothetical protein
VQAFFFRDILVIVVGHGMARVYFGDEKLEERG